MASLETEEEEAFGMALSGEAETVSGAAVLALWKAVGMAA